ncbi:MAG: serine hydrolase [Alphaproteobacteria bacterium]|nr:serine hydrolase [Alphaproteobacteria bacterium]
MIRALTFIAAAIGLALAAAVLAFVVLRRDLPPAGAPSTGVAGAPMAASAIDASRADVASVRRDKYYPSLSVAVARSGEILWSEAIGVADIDARTPATPETRYPIGSVSKPFTAAAAMVLAAQGAVDLDVSISIYAPSLPDAYGRLTLRQLLSHQAGVRHYRFALIPPAFTENGMNREFATTEDSLAIFIDDPLLFEPDASFAYSTFGYTLAAHALEKATGRPFLALMDDIVLAPLDLASVAPDRASPAPAGRSTDYMAMLRKLGIIPSPDTNSSYKWAGGGFVATPTDLARFGDALLAGALIDAAQFTEMTTPRRTAEGAINPQSYGLGWRSGTMAFPRGGAATTPIIHHGGTAAGSECALLLAPDFATTVAACGNAFTGGSGALIQLAADIARHFEAAASEAARP